MRKACLDLACLDLIQSLGRLMSTTFFPWYHFQYESPFSHTVLPNSRWNSYAAVSKSKEHQMLLLWLSSTGQEFTLQATDVKKLCRSRFGNCRLLLLLITFATGLTSICDQSIAPHCSINEQNNTNGCLTETIWVRSLGCNAQFICKAINDNLHLVCLDQQ